MSSIFRLFGSSIYCFLSILCFFRSFGQAPDIVNTEQRIDSLFSRYSLNTPGVAVGIVQNGKIVLSKGYGSANLEYNVPITPKTIFHVASVSKQFTAFAIYLLKDQGLLSLEDDIKKFIPELPDYGYPIKIKHLLAHTSGLRDQWALLTLSGWQLEDIITTEQILKLTIQQKALNFKPGTAFSYCNTSYTLLAETVARITGKKFSEFTKEYIFEPLGMFNTRFYDNFHDIVKNRAYSYEQRDNTYVKKKLNYSNVGPTSLFTNIEDLVKWSNNFENPLVGNQELLEEFNQVSTLDNGKPVVFNIINQDTLYHAKGQIKRIYRGMDIMKHGGHDAGFRTFLARFPQKKMSIITLSNDEHYEIFARGLGIAEFFLEDQMDSARPNKQKRPFKKDLPKKYGYGLENFLGDYSSDELSTIYTIHLEHGNLVISHKRLHDMILTRKGDTTFSGTNYFNFEIDFIKGSDDVIKGFEISNFGVQKLFFKRIVPDNY